MSARISVGLLRWSAALVGALVVCLLAGTASGPRAESKVFRLGAFHDGFVKSLARPGGNLTGFAGIGDVPAKEIEITPRRLAEYRRGAGLLKVQLGEREATPSRACCARTASSSD